METIKEAIKTFAKPDCGEGSGWGRGSGEGSGWGDGSGWGSGNGSGEGSGDGSGRGSGEGSGDGSGWGSGEGSGWGDGSGWGSGNGSGEGNGVKNFCGNVVYLIDNVPTLIDRVHGSVARGRMLNRDLTLTPCYIAKGCGLFAHGETLQEARDALEEKIMDGLSAEEKIGQFMEKFLPRQEYPAREFWRWHHALTGSCEMGRNQFAADHGIDLDRDMMTPEKFMDLTRNAYGCSVIQRLIDTWEERFHEGKTTGG